MKRLNVTLIGVIFFSLSCAAQDDFHFKRNIDDVQREGWHTIALPDGIFDDLNGDFSDIRIFSISDKDTLEIPYILDVQTDVVTMTRVTLPVRNKSFADDALYLMFELDAAQPVNYLDLDFAETNYFGLVNLQGSDDRRQWFDILTDQRIVSVDKQSRDDYTLSRIDFSRTDYRFLRVRVQADVPLTFQDASFRHNKVEKGSFRSIPLTWTSREKEKGHQTIVDIRLGDYVPVSSIKVRADSMRDYYRPLRIEFVADSFKTDKGWIKSYETLYDGHLTSFRPNEFSFPWKLAREIRMVVTHFDDRAIAIRDISAVGPRVDIIAKLQPGNNFMLYGREGMRAPSYDLAYFQSNIPDSLVTAQLASAETLIVADADDNALFQNKLWLWAIMAIAIAGLGFFTIKMMRQP